MVKFLIHKPVSVIMVFIALLLLGIVAVKNIAISPLPNVDIPEIIVHVNEDNLSANELEGRVIEKLRLQLSQISGVEDVNSETKDGFAVIKLRFKYGTDLDFAFLEVNEKIDLSMNLFPRDIARPRVIKSTVADIPVFYLNLSLRDPVNTNASSSRFIELSDFAQQVVKRKLEQLPEIAFVDMTGFSGAEVFIEPNINVSKALGLKTDDIARIIQSTGQIPGDVQIEEGQLLYNVRFEGFKTSNLDELKNIVFKHKGRILKLCDIANIGVRPKAERGAFIAGNKRAINLAVIKQADSQMTDLQENLQGLLGQLERDYPEIEFEQTQDQTELLSFSISNLKQDLYIGSFLAFILMFFFLKNIRAPLLIGITIPVSLILCILFFKAFGITINIISLSGLVLGVGLMIDNSIIVIDNISQYREKNVSLSEACVRGTNEIIRPIISSCLTTCSVFLPLVFLSGISGALFYDQAMAITIGLAVSLLVSITLLPTLFRLFHKGNAGTMEADFFERFGITFFERFYERGFFWVFKNKLVTVIAVVILVCANLFLFQHLKKEKLPAFQEKAAIVNIDWNQNLNLEENKRRVEALIKTLRRSVTQINATVGTQQYLLDKGKRLVESETEFFIQTDDLLLRAKVESQITKWIERNYPKAIVKIKSPPTLFDKVFGDDEPPLVAELSFKEQQDEMPKVSAIKALIESRVEGAIVSDVPTNEVIQLSADPEKLLMYNLSLINVNNTLKTILGKSEISSLNKGSEQIPIILGSDKKTELSDLLYSHYISNNEGVLIPLYNVITYRKEKSWSALSGNRDGNFIPLAIQTDKPTEVMRLLEKQVGSNDDLKVAFSGSFFSNKVLLKEMAVVLMVSVLLLYFILAAQFESLVQPLIVLLELPISMSGALIMLYCFGSSINLISLIGLVVMGGIIINDSILKIDAINDLRRNQGYALMDAIHTGGVKRLKSIIMTSMTTILSVAPFLFGTDMGSILQRPLSLALIGGMIIGTPVSLYFIPLAYWFYYRKE